MNPNFEAALQASSAVVALFGGGADMRIFRDEAPDGTAAPYGRWQVVGGQPENYLGEVASIDDLRVQFMVFADPDHQADVDAGVRALRDALAELGYVVSFNATGRDPETRRWFGSFDMSFWSRV